MTLYLLEFYLNQIAIGDSRELIGLTMPVNWLSDPAKVKLRFAWQSYQQGRDFCRYINTHGWRSYSIWDYEPRKQEPKPFVMLKSMEVLS
jgi:hypothetical protein